MNDQVSESSTANSGGRRELVDEKDSSLIWLFSGQNVLPTTTQETQQVNVVDDTTLQAVLSSMSETEMNAFLEELNKTGKACKTINYFCLAHIIFLL